MEEVVQMVLIPSPAPVLLDLLMQPVVQVSYCMVPVVLASVSNGTINHVLFDIIKLNMLKRIVKQIS